MKPTYPLVYRWKKYNPELYGQRCRLLAKGKKNSVLVEFEDGTKHVISGNALKKAKGSNVLIEIRHKTDASVKPVQCVVCEACKCEGPRVECSEEETEKAPAATAAMEHGWTEHCEPIRTAVRKHMTGSYVVQYFCPKCKDKVGTIPEVRESRRKK